MKCSNLQEDAGGGLVFWHPKGAIIRHTIEDSWKKIHIEHGYDLLYTPHVARVDLWNISGHLDFYRENMFDQMNIEDELYQLRPMNCPYHILVYKRKLHSYRDFPIRVAELGTVYRYELSGSLHGLFRVRGFTQVCNSWCSQEYATDMNIHTIYRDICLTRCFLFIQVDFLAIWKLLVNSGTVCTQVVSFSYFPG